MDHSKAPVLDALKDYHQQDRYGFSPPGHRQGRGVDERVLAERHFSHPPSPERVSGAWEEHPDAAGALIVSPTPYGTCADLERIAEICHQRGKPLTVDEAWGAHLPFHP
jgi:arginine decarboxylase